MKKTVNTTQLIHEVTSSGQHRIVYIFNGMPKASPWVEHHQIAILKEWRACLSGNAALPQGIFTARQCLHEQFAAQRTMST